MRRPLRVCSLKILGALLVPASLAISQTADSQDLALAESDVRAPAVAPTEQGHNAALGGQVVGQRQSQKAGIADASPLNRIYNRLQNRVENRLRTRIDRTYRPQTNGPSPYEVSESQSRKKQ